MCKKLPLVEIGKVYVPPLEAFDLGMHLHQHCLLVYRGGLFLIHPKNVILFGDLLVEVQPAQLIIGLGGYGWGTEVLKVSFGLLLLNGGDRTCQVMDR